MLYVNIQYIVIMLVVTLFQDFLVGNNINFILTMILPTYIYIYIYIPQNIVGNNRYCINRVLVTTPNPEFSCCLQQKLLINNVSKIISH